MRFCFFRRAYRAECAAHSWSADAFAHLTLEASQDSLDRCFKALNRSTWFSNVLRVERANEHYMERLSRESGGPDSTSADDWWGHDGSPPDKPPISQLRLSDTSLPRGKRRKNRILVSLGPNPSSSHSHFDEDGALVPNTGGEDVWSKEALGGRKKPPTVPGPDTVPHAAPTRTAPSDATDSDAAETVAVDHGYTRGVRVVAARPHPGRQFSRWNNVPLKCRRVTCRWYSSA